MINRIIAPINAEIPHVVSLYKAICRQAVIDYKAALKVYDIPSMREIEGFFCSEFFRMVCGYGGKRVAKAIWQRVNDEETSAVSRASATLKRLNKTSICNLLKPTDQPHSELQGDGDGAFPVTGSTPVSSWWQWCAVVTGL